VALTILRRALGDQTTPVPFLIGPRASVQLKRASTVALDLTIFDELLRACARHAHAGGALCPVCVARLSDAAALCRGEFLQHLAGRCRGILDMSHVFKVSTSRRS
jgi:hypothetical protein